MSSHLIGFDGLAMVADAACELDAYKDHLAGAERARIVRMVDELHAMVERCAGPAADLIYAPDDAAPAVRDTATHPALEAQGA